MNNWWVIVLIVFGSYLLGCFNNAIMITKIKKTDIRKVGSGNPGTMNMSRNFGIRLGLLTLFLDMLKGLIPALVGYFVLRGKTLPDAAFDLGDLGMFLCGFFAVLGHIYPVFYKFKGGKGIATTIGVFLAWAILMAVSGEWGWFFVEIMSLIAAVFVIYLTEYGAMGSIIAITPPAVASSIRLFLLYHIGPDTPRVIPYYIAANVLIFGICFITWFAHRNNIERMLAGEEHPTSIKEMFVKMREKKAEKLAKADAEKRKDDKDGKK